LLACCRIEITIAVPPKTKSPLRKERAGFEIHQRLTQPTPLYRIWLNQNRPLNELA
jgi:hypothetical protein